MYSLRDSIIKHDDLVARLKEIGQNAVAITDHGRSLGGISFYKALNKNGIKYIHGCELYICKDAKEKDKNNRYYHLVALCENETGRKNLNALMSQSEHPENFYYKPRIDFSMLKEHSDGLIILSACLAGEVARLIQNGEYEEAASVASRYKDVFGDRYYLEIQSRNDPAQIEVNKEILLLSRNIGIPCVVTCDAHFTHEKDREYQNKYAFNGKYKEEGESYLDCFVQSEAEVRERLAYLLPAFVDDVIANTHVISDRCNLTMPLSAPIMPSISTPPEFASNKDWLDNICTGGFSEKLGIEYDRAQKTGISMEMSDTKIQEYIDRFNYEIDSLEQMGFIDYILLVYTYSNVGTRRGIARGSGGGSLVCYLSNITNIDPIEHGLYFERFIDVGALKLLESGEITSKELKIPDIDLDFSGESCKEVLKFLYDTYGESRVASIGKFTTNQTRGTIRDMCRVLDIDLQCADEIAKSFEQYEIDEIDNMISGEIPTTGSASDAISFVRMYPVLFDYVRKLNGLPKSFGLHACGKVISTRELDEFLPSCYDDEGIRYLQGDMHDVEDVGLVKIDVLGLRTLDQEYDTLEMSGQTEEFINPKQDYTDDKVLDVFRNGNTVGIFQMASPGMKRTLKKMSVDGIESLSIANALYRPGAMAYIDNYCDRRAGRESVEYLHGDLEPILKQTYGIVVFQEQLIEIGRLAKIHNPDLLRKATGKKDLKLLAQVKPELEESLLSRGWSQKQFDKLWVDMLEFSKYSFNKSHSSAYGIIAYMTAKQKAYYPAEFFAGLLNSYFGKSSFVKDNADEIVSDMERHKVRIAPFNFRNDHRRCRVKDGEVVYGIPLIKECNEQVANALYEIRNTDYSRFWNLLADLFARTNNKAQVKILIQLDFFRDFGNAKLLTRIVEVYEYFMSGSKGARKQISKSKLPDGGYLADAVKKYSTDKNAKGKELKSYTILDVDSILNECEDRLRAIVTDDFDYRSKAITHNEYLGFVSLTTGDERDRSRLFVKKIYPAVRKADGHQFGYNVTAQSIGSGKTSIYTILNPLFKKEPVETNDVIRCFDWRRGNQGYFKILDYQVEV